MADKSNVSIDENDQSSKKSLSFLKEGRLPNEFKQINDNHNDKNDPSKVEGEHKRPSETQTTKVPFWAKRLLSNRDQDSETAYQLQIKGAREGAIRWTIYSTILCGMGHIYWPFFRKQTLAFKGFIVSSAAMSGMVIWADHYLLKHERYLRKADDMMRRQARKELGEQGIIATESELNKWKLQKLENLKNPK